MSDPYVGEIRLFAGNFAPRGWYFCNGAALPISENEVLFTLIGTTYGGDGVNTFNLPDLRGRLPVHAGNGFVLGQQAGSEEVTLIVGQMPGHSHVCEASTNLAGASDPAGNVPGQVGAIQIYRETTPSVAMSASALNSAGGSQPHENLQPFLCVSFIIAWAGTFPTT